MTAKAAVVGWPIEHSLSPVLHGYWLKKYGIDGSYGKIAIEPGTFAAHIAKLRAKGYRGINVTVPYKEEAFALATKKHSTALEAGAANLLVFGQEIEAHNTDTYGLIQALGPAISLSGNKTVVLLGAGGSARGAVLALAKLGVVKVHILNRTVSRAVILAKDLQEAVAPEIVPGALENWSAVSREAHLLVNCTSAGMNGNPPLDIDLSLLSKSAWVCDIVYNPLVTPLLRAADALGLKTIDGLEMLMHQAVPSFEAFFRLELKGKRPSVTPALRAALIAALEARG